MGALEQRTPTQELVARVRGNEFTSQVELALPENISPKRFVRATVTALLQNPDIAQCEPDSIFNALLRSAQDGLIPDGREAALVKYGTKAQYLPMIGGYRKIAAEYGWAIRAQVVYANDYFEHEVGLNESLTHRPVRPGEERGEPLAAYAVGTHRDGRKQFIVMYAQDIEKVKASSKTSGRGPWVEWPDRMWEKTVGRRLFKELPLDPADQRIASLIAADEPGAAAEALYGSRAVIEGTSTSPLAASADTRAQSAPAGEQQHEPSARPPETPSAAADGSAPDQAFDDEPRPDEQAADEVEGFDEDDVEAAGQVVVPNGANKGKTLAEVAASGPDGEKWLLWCCKSGPEPLKDAALLYVHARVDDVWARYEAWQAEQS